MAELLGALMELFGQVIVLVIELIGGMIGAVFERLDRGSSRAGSTSAEASPTDSDR